MVYIIIVVKYKLSLVEDTHTKKRWAFMF